MNKMKYKYKSIIVLSFLFVSGLSAQNKCTDSVCCSKWDFEFSAGTWNTSVQGDLSANKLPGYIDISLSDKLKDPDYSYFAEFEARKNNLILIGQFTSINQTGSGSFHDTLYSYSRSTTRPLFVTAGLAFNFYNNDKFDVQLFGGARYNLIRNDIETFFVSGGSQKENESKGFIDPLAGARFNYTPFNRIYLKGYFDIGGFGMVSFLSFQSYLAAGYQFNENFSLRLGYRYLDVHYTTDNFNFKTGMQGFEFAASTRF